MSYDRVDYDAKQEFNWTLKKHVQTRAAVERGEGFSLLLPQGEMRVQKVDSPEPHKRYYRYRVTTHQGVKEYTAVTRPIHSTLSTHLSIHCGPYSNGRWVANSSDPITALFHLWARLFTDYEERYAYMK